MTRYKIDVISVTESYEDEWQVVQVHGRFAVYRRTLLFFWSRLATFDTIQEAKTFAVDLKLSEIPQYV